MRFAIGKIRNSFIHLGFEKRSTLFKKVDLETTRSDKRSQVGAEYEIVDIWDLGCAYSFAFFPSFHSLTQLQQLVTKQH